MLFRSDRGMVNVETTLLQQLLNIAQRKRIAQIQPDGTKDEAGFGLPPLEDRGSGYHFAILSRHHPATLKVATHPSRLTTYDALTKTQPEPSEQSVCSKQNAQTLCYSGIALEFAGVAITGIAAKPVTYQLPTFR